MIDFEIKQGGKYVTRGGDTVIVTGNNINNTYIWKVMDAKGRCYTVTRTGREYDLVVSSQKDIVAEYKEKDVDVGMTYNELKELVGEKVWCVAFGEGKIVEVYNYECNFPVEVSFKDGNNRTYTRDFKFYVGSERCLYFSKPTVEGDLLPSFKPKLIGKVVKVYNTESGIDMYVKVDDETKHSITYSLHGTGGYSVNKQNYTIELVDNG